MKKQNDDEITFIGEYGTCSKICGANSYIVKHTYYRETQEVLPVGYREEDTWRTLRQLREKRLAEE